MTVIFLSIIVTRELKYHKLCQVCFGLSHHVKDFCKCGGTRYIYFHFTVCGKTNKLKLKLICSVRKQSLKINTLTKAATIKHMQLNLKLDISY